MHERRRPRLMWQKTRDPTPGEREFRLAGLRENPDALRVLEAPLAPTPEEWNPKWS